MPQIINTNIASLSAQRNLDRSQSANETALNRLSSGLRINSAKDDAAGLAISTRFDAQTKGLGVAIRNAGDGVSLAQTAEGALGSMTENLQRIRELAVQSANATNSDDDRVALQAEVEQLVAEITRTSEETTFNGRKLLDGSFEGTFQIGADAGQTLDIKIEELTANKLGVGSATGVSAIGTSDALQNGDLIINGVTIDPSRASSDSASVSGAGASAIAKVEAINAKSDETGVTAQVDTNVAAGTEMVAGATSGAITLNGVEINIATGGVNLSADRDSVISAINAKTDQTGVMAVDGGVEGGVILEAEDGRNITMAFDATNLGAADQATAEAATGLTVGTSYGGYTLISDDGSDIVVSGGQGTGTGDIARAGLTAGTYSGKEAAVTTTERSSSTSVTETSGTYTTGDMGITAGTLVNATNNTFELSVDGGAFQTLTLDQTDTPTGGTQGQYDDATELASLITQAIAADTNFQDADGNALVTVAATADGNGLVFTSAEAGADSSVIARQGSGNMAIVDGGTSTLGSDAETFARVSMNFNFDGTNTLTIADTTASTLQMDLTGAGLGSQTDLAIALGTGTYTDAATFATAVNAAIAASTSANGKVTAAASEDGTAVEITAVFNTTDAINTTAIAFDAAGTTLTQDQGNQSIQHLTNGDVVITDVSDLAGNYSYGAGTAAGTDSIGINVDGGGMQTLEINVGAVDTTGGNYGGIAQATTSAAYWAAAIQYAADTSIAGSGITATAVGDQVVISSRSTTGGTVALGPEVTSTTAANSISAFGAVTDIDFTNAAATTAGNLFVSAQAATLETASWNVADGTGTDAAGTFLSADPDGTVATFDAVATAITITDGVNDSFEISVDGGSSYTTIDLNTTTVAATYNTLGELATAINTALTTASAGATVAIGANNDTLVFTNADATAADQDLGVELRDGTFSVTGNSVNGALVTQETAPNGLETGDLVINGTSIAGANSLDDTASDDTATTSDISASGISIAAAINKSSAETGVTAEVNATKLVGGDESLQTAAKADTGSQGSIIINNVETQTITLTGDADLDRLAAIDAINAQTGQTGVTAEDNGESITLIAADGRNVSVAIDNKLATNDAAGLTSSNFGNAIGLSAGESGVGEADITGSAATYANTAGTSYSSVTLKSAGAIELSNGENGADELQALGLQLGTYGGGEDGTFLKDVDISTFSGAQAAITAVDNALNQVAGQRADLGALQNRFESTVSNLTITRENLTAANSRIKDADFAAESAELSRTQVLQQAGISILAQANQRPQQVLSLIG
jgi:flagellin